MNRRSSWKSLALALAIALAAGACRAPAPPAESAEPHGHAHVAPRGGTLVELGDHAAHAEFVFDAASGTLTAYLLDNHAEKPVRVADAVIAVEVTLPSGQAAPLRLEARANVLTGESVGDTSEFAGTSEALRGAASFRIAWPALTMRGVETPAANILFPGDHP